MLAVDLLQIGAVYTEADLGSDIHGDTFEITFEGGAPGTQLTQLIVNGDQGTPGFGEGDVFFDHEAGGYGADDAHPFTIVALETDDPNASITAFLEDGGLLLTLELVGFQAGDRLIFSIDVDEVEDFDPNESDLTLVNEGFDPITSGVEFQGSQLSAHFVAPNFFDASGSGEFRNRYDGALAASGIDLPADNAGGQRDRTDGVMFPVEQVPLPIAISGTVFLDSDLDLVQDAGDVPLPGVALALWVETNTPGDFEFTGHTVTTDANGDYEFGLSLELPPGVYQVREAQPDGLFSVGAIPGTIAGNPVGSVGDADRLTGIAFPRGGERAIDYDFAEAQPASISGFVYHDRDNNGIRDANGKEEGLSGIVVDVIPVSTIAPQATVRQTTDENGFYSASDLSPGDYRVVEVHQPAAFFDGLDQAGTVAGHRRGSAVNPGDSLEGVRLFGNDAGIEYNFGEIAPASLGGRVHLSNADGDCLGDHSLLPPLEGVTVQLLNADGQLIRETTTDAGGAYQFDQLLPGEYTLVEVTPTGLLDGSEHLGSVSGSLRGQLSGNDHMSMIVLGSGDQGVRYDFCEHEPASVSGFVYHDLNNNGDLELAEERIGGVEVNLLGDAGQIVATRQTNADGFYAFTQLRSGHYTLQEVQPDGWIDGLDSAGTIDGEQIGVAENPGDVLQDVNLRYGDRGLNYNFGELLPVKIGGFVYHDRNDNGIREAGEEGLGGVALTVIPLDTFAQQQTVTVTTSADGMYMTGMLSPGRYEVIENVQPDGYFDGQDTPGLVAGQPQGIVANPGDRLTNILLTSGQVGTDYNFGELLPSSISGRVHLSDSAADCFDESVVHPPVSGVVLSLLNERGDLIARTATDENGEYEFQGLVPGTYTVVEEDPVELLDGGERAGQVDGVVVGEVTANDTIASIVLLAGQNAVHYDFCEHEPAQISGYVYHDSNNNGKFEDGEEVISGTTVSLFDNNAQFLAAQQTEADGSYGFHRLLAGVYTLREQQPGGWRDGLDTAGTVGSAVVGAAVNPGDEIDGIQLKGGDRGVQYNFGELLPASISGTIHSDLNENCEVDAGETLLAGVTVELLDPDGRVIGSTRSDEFGRYRFDDLLPGRYSVREVQPDGFFQGHQRPGSHGAQQESQDLITVDVASGDQLVGYDFCETPPSQLSGYAFQDGPTIVTPDGQVPENLAEVRDGRRTSDDIPIAGVVLQLRDGLDGTPITAADALPGFYAPGQISAVTGPDGFYEFSGIRGHANYSVYQVHPTGFVDGIDTAGSTSGLAVNLSLDATSPILERYAGIPRNDAIVLIPLRSGDASLENNFSEVRLELERSPIPPAERPSPPPVAREVYVPALVSTPATQSIAIRATTDIPLYGGGSRYTWHLSVVDGGMPRGIDSADTVNVMIWRQATYLDVTRWQDDNLQQARWTLRIDGDSSDDEEAELLRRFGIEGAIPVTGDFNGDGVSEIGVFYKGEWFVDLNGNGRWDEEDLWALLGGKGDRPVTGDWDGDGKDDIGIFGPAWTNDERAIRAEPGLPDVLNVAHEKPKNTPPKPEEAAEGRRLMRLHANGIRRADLIDHVFQFGAARDVPVAADLDGDGIVSIGTFRDGQWKLDVDGDGRFGEQDRKASFGQAGDVPVIGDFNGDGVDEIGIYRAGTWQIDANRNFELDAHDRVFELGDGADRPVVGDWDGDGEDEPGVYAAE